MCKGIWKENKTLLLLTDKAAYSATGLKNQRNSLPRWKNQELVRIQLSSK